jgi:hypothetical protein
MTNKIFSAAAVLIGAGSLLAGCSFEQPSAGCISQDATNWQAVYTLDEASVAVEAGSTKTLAECTTIAKANQGELLGVFKFVDPNNRSDAKLVLRPNGLASRAVRDPGDPYASNAVGKYSTTPDANDFCSATDFNTAFVDDPGREANPTATPPVTAIAKTKISYKFNDVAVYASPNAPGTQLKGSLDYNRDGCIAKYKVAGVWPQVACDPDSDKPKETCGEGSGANPDFALECHATLHVCVPSKEIPSFK